MFAKPTSSETHKTYVRSGKQEHGQSTNAHGWELIFLSIHVLRFSVASYSGCVGE